MEERRTQFACVRCKRLKVKCATDEGSVSCKRCEKAGVPCISAPTSGAGGGGGGASGSIPGGTISRIRKPEPRNHHRLAHVEQIILESKPVLTQEDRYAKVEQLEKIINEAKNELQSLQPQLAIIREYPYDSNNQVKPEFGQFNQYGQHNQVFGGQNNNDTNYYNNNNNNHNQHPQIGSGDLVTIESGIKPTWRPEVLQTANPVQAMVDLGMLTKQEAEQYYQYFFKSSMDIYCQGWLEPGMTLDQHMAREPMCAMAVVICSRLVNTLEKGEIFSAFFDRVITERITILNECTLDALKALLLNNIFTHAGLDPRFSVFVLMQIPLLKGLSLGNNDDNKQVLSRSNVPEQTRKLALERLRLLLGVHLCVMATSLHVNRAKFVGLLPNISSSVSAMNASPYIKTGDRLMLMLTHVAELAHEGYALISQPHRNKRKYEDLRKTLDKYTSQMQDMVDKMGPLVGFDESDSREDQVDEQQQRQNGNATASTIDSEEEAHKKRLAPLVLAFRSCFVIFMIALHEATLFQAVFSCDPIPSDDTYTILIQQVIGLCHQSVNFFLGLYNSGTAVPRYMFLRPLYALSSLIRVRMTVWSLGLNIHVDVDTPFTQIKACWDTLKRKSYTADRMMLMLQKIERWKQIRVANKSSDGAAAPPAGADSNSASGASEGAEDSDTRNQLQMLLKEVTFSLTMDMKDRVNRSMATGGVGTPGSTPASSSSLSANASSTSPSSLSSMDPFRSPTQFLGSDANPRSMGMNVDTPKMRSEQVSPPYVDANDILVAPPEFEFSNEMIDPLLSTVDPDSMIRELFSDTYRYV